MDLFKYRPIFLLLSLLLMDSVILSGCQMTRSVSKSISDHLVGPLHKIRDWDTPSDIHKDLISLPLSQGRIVTAVYGFRDQSGQYKPPPASSFSTAVTQGASSMLIGALEDSGWFIPVEREGLQNILTERKIIRATLKKAQPNADLNPLLGANIIIEGGIVAYDTDIRTGGMGAKYFGIGSSEQYRVDQVTISLRAVDIYSGKIVNSVLVTRAILSIQVNFGVFRFVKFKRLLELETGFTRNEPTQVIVLDAIESAVIRLIVTGIHKRNWGLNDPNDLNHPIIKAYSNDHWLADSRSLLEAPTKENSTTPNTSKSRPPQTPSRLRSKQQSQQKPQQKSQRENPETRQPSSTTKNSKPPKNTAQRSSNEKQSAGENNPNGQRKIKRQTQQTQKQKNSANMPLNDSPSPENIQFYTVQLVATSNRQAIAPFITENALNPNQINYIEFIKNGKRWYAATAGKYTTKQAARNALHKLSPKLKSYQPWIRTIKNNSVM